MSIRIGGFLRHSTIDFPGKTGPVIYLQGCNFKCAYCHNPDLVGKVDYDALIDPEEIFSFLKRMKGFADVVTITGGEPTLQTDKLIQFCEQIKKTGNIKIKLDTNGTNPGILRELAQSDLIDYVAMDIKGPPLKYHLLTKHFRQGLVDDIQTSAEMLIGELDIPYEFRTTMVFPFIDVNSIADVEQYARVVSGAKQVYLQLAKIDDTVLTPMAFQSINPSGDSFAWDRDSVEKFMVVAQKLGRNIKNISIR